MIETDLSEAAIADVGGVSSVIAPGFQLSWQGPYKRGMYHLRSDRKGQSLTS